MKSFVVCGRAKFGNGDVCALAIRKGSDSAGGAGDSHRSATIPVSLRCNFPSQVYDCDQLVELNEIARLQRFKAADSIVNSPDSFADIFSAYVLQQPYCLIARAPGFYSSPMTVAWMRSAMPNETELNPRIDNECLIFLAVAMNTSSDTETLSTVKKITVTLDSLYANVEDVAQWRSTWANYRSRADGE